MKLRKILYAALGLLLLALVAVIAAPFFIPAETYKAQLLAEAESMTGRKIRADGPVSFRLFPNIALTLREVGVGNPEWTKGGELFTAKEIALGVELAPLFERRLSITHVELDTPVIALQKQGERNNWTISPAQKQGGAAQAEAPGEPLLRGLSLEKLAVRNGTLRLREGESLTELSGIDLDASLPDVDKPASLSGKLLWQERRVSWKATLDNAEALLAKRPVTVDATVDASGASASWKGRLTLTPSFSAQGALEAEVSDLSAFGVKAEGAALPGRIAVHGQTQIEQKGGVTRAQLQQARVALDGQELAGQASVRIGEGRPQLSASLQGKSFTLDPFLPKPNSKAEQQAAAREPAKPIVWSDAPLFDPASLRQANAAVELALEALTYGDYTLAPFHASVKLESGQLRLDLPKAGIFGGQVSGQASVDASGASPLTRLNLKVANMQAEPMLTSLAQFNRLSGTLNANAAFEARGNSQKAMVTSLNGDGKVVFSDGAIKGINLAAMARNVQSAFGQAVERDESAKTDFSELSGSFQARQGVISNQDLALRSPFLRLSGAGQVNLPDAQVDYRLKPTIVANIEGQGAQDAEGQKGLVVPILVRGPLHKPSYAPDLQAILQDRKQIEQTIKDAKPVLKDLKETVKDKDKLKDALKGFLGGGKAQPAPQPAPAP